MTLVPNKSTTADVAGAASNDVTVDALEFGADHDHRA